MRKIKEGGVIIASLIFFVSLPVTALFADDHTVALESVVIETFDGDSPYEWRTDGVKFTGKKDVSLLPVYPQALFRTAAEGEGKQSLGLRGQFTRKGYNWIDIYPVSKDNLDGGAVEIPLSGVVHYVDVWAWGSNLHYKLEAYVRDYRGMIHRVDMGSLAFFGWKNLRASVPSNFPMTDHALPVSSVSSKFVKFRLWTEPDERVGLFYFYLDQLKILTDTFKTRFDGDELSDSDAAEELWAGAGQQE
jgi:hypothetical protein